MNETSESKQGNIGIVMLAAGASTRMGSPKQLLKLDGVPLIRRAATHALQSTCRPVVVVLGANAELIVPCLNDLPIQIAFNHEWSRGMSSSVRRGLEALLASNPRIEGVILFLADQPNVTGASLRKLTAAHVQSGSGLVAAYYSGQLGTPALFPRSYFDELLANDGPGGAKNLLERYASRVLPIDFPEATIDLDTPEDFAQLSIAPDDYDRVGRASPI